MTSFRVPGDDNQFEIRVSLKEAPVNIEDYLLFAVMGASRHEDPVHFCKVQPSFHLFPDRGEAFAAKLSYFAFPMT